MAGARRQERQSVILSDFLGVDFTSSPLQTSPRRSPRAVNWITDRSGHNCKRGGWQQIGSVPTNADGTPRRVNGMWQFDEGGRKVLLVHAGDTLYRSIGAVGEDGVPSDADRLEPVIGGESGLEDGRSQGFFFGGRLYLVGVGQYAVYGTWDGGESYRLRPMADCEDAYVPTTTVGIGPIGSDTEGGQSVEDVNLLTRWRINTLVGSSTAGASYRLDGPLAVKANAVSVRIEYENTAGDIEIVEPKAVLSSMGVFGGTHTLWIGDNRIGKIVSQKDSAVLTLNVAYPATVPDVPNITVKFLVDEKYKGAAASLKETAASLIGNCRFGAVFGAGGNANRLVLSGNPAHPNMQYWCEIGDPTYFPDRLTSVVGSSSVPITGMMRLSDGVLAVFKDDVGQEPTIYYQQASEDVSGGASSGNLPLVIKTVAGNVGEAVVSRAACADFFGDPLILSRNGVFGITMRANVATGDRYAVERSHFVRARLCREDLSEAVATVHDGRYYLAVGGSCYVADAEHRATPPGGSHYQYEWWFWGNMPARVFCSFGGELWFGTADGRICRMREGVFLDESYERFGEGEMALEENGIDVAVSDSVGQLMKAGDRVQIELEGQPYRELGAFYISDDVAYTVITADRSVTEEIGAMMDDGVIVHLESMRELVPIVETDPRGNPVPVIPAGTRFVVDKVRLDEHSYSMMLRHTEEDGGGGFNIDYYYDWIDRGPVYGPILYKVGDGDFRILLVKVGGNAGLYVRSVDPVDGRDGTTGYTVRFSTTPDGDAYVFPECEGGTRMYPIGGRIIRETPIDAEWYTPVLDLGSAMHRKTLLRLSTVCEPGLGGRMEVGYETRRASRVVRGGESGQLDLGDLDFSDFTFDGFASSHTVRLCERRVNYVALRIRSEGAHDCRVHEMRVVYRTDRECRGVE